MIHSLSSVGLLAFPSLIYATVKPYLSTTFIKTPMDTFPSLTVPYLIENQLTKVDQDYWDQFRTVKKDFTNKKQLLRSTLIRVKSRVFCLCNYWRTERDYHAFLQSIEVDKLKQELAKNNYVYGASLNASEMKELKRQFIKHQIIMDTV